MHQPFQTRREIVASGSTGLEYSNSPELVAFAITYRCNLACRHCIQPTLNEKPRDMSLRLYGSLIDEICRLGWRPHKLQFHHFGESLMHRDLPTMIRIAKDRLPGAFTYIHTNGHFPLQPILSEGIDEVVLCLDGADASSYEVRRCSGKFETVVANLKEALVFEGRGRVVVQILEYDTADFAKVVDKFGPLLKKNDQIVMRKLGTWNGRVQVPTDEFIWRGQLCREIGRTLVIDGEGRCTPCCVDMNMSLMIGTLNSDVTNLDEIWHSEANEALIKAFRENRHSSYPLCARCVIPVDEVSNVYP